MPRKQKKYHYLYKTTNLINEKFYVGMHSTDNLDDEYLGSGKYLWNSINKHGKENFKREILEFFENREDLKDREKNYVNENFIQDPLCMNLMRGGEGGSQSPEKLEKWRLAGNKANKNKWENNLEFQEYWKNTYLIKYSDNMRTMNHSGKTKPFSFNNTNWLGRKHKQESKDAIGKANKVQQYGEKNSQFKTCWITKDGLNKKIKEEELDENIKLGWTKGRNLPYDFLNGKWKKKD